MKVNSLTKRTFWAYILISFFFFKGLSWAIENKKQWKNELEAGYNLNSGNTETETWHTSWITDYQQDKNEFLFQFEARFGKVDSETNEENYNGLLNYDRAVTQKVSLFIFQLAQKDKFQKLAMRLDTGSGLKYTFIKDLIKEFSLSGAVLYEYENFSDDSHNDDFVRGSFRPKFKWIIYEDIRFSTELYYQPRVDNLKDYRINWKSSFIVSSRSGVGIKLTFLHKYDNLPQEGIKYNDSSLVTSILVSF